MAKAHAPAPLRSGLRGLAAAAGLLCAAPAAAHHPAGGDKALALSVADRRLGVHYRTEALELWGRIDPPSAAEGEPIQVEFSARWQGQPYAGAARVALTDPMGGRTERTVQPDANGAYRARLPAELPDGDAVVLELAGAAGARVVVPYEVRSSALPSTYLALAALLAIAALLLARIARAQARRPGRP